MAPRLGRRRRTGAALALLLSAGCSGSGESGLAGVTLAAGPHAGGGPGPQLDASAGSGGVDAGEGGSASESRPDATDAPAGSSGAGGSLPGATSVEPRDGGETSAADASGGGSLGGAGGREAGPSAGGDVGAGGAPGSGGGRADDGSIGAGGMAGVDGSGGALGAGSDGGPEGADGGFADASDDGQGGADDSSPDGSDAAASPDTGGGTPDDCSAPPNPPPLVGWAAVSDKGVSATTGGGSTTPQIVSSLEALQTALNGATPAVVYVRGVLAAGELKVGSNKTLVGLCGAELHGSVKLDGASNVILRNLKIVGYAIGDCALDPGYSANVGCASGSDALLIQGQSHHVWLDHDDISDGAGSGLEISHGSDYVTVSWTKFHYTPRTDTTGIQATGAAGHRFATMIGDSDTNSAEDSGHLRVTLHHDWWADNVSEKQPRVRFGKVHVFDSLWTSTGDTACVGVGVSASIRLENDVFSDVATAIDASLTTGAVASTGNVYANTTGTAPADREADTVFQPSDFYAYTLDETTGLETAIRAGAGPK